MHEQCILFIYAEADSRASILRSPPLLSRSRFSVIRNPCAPNSRLNDYWVFVSDTPFLPTDTPATLQGRPGTFSSHQTAAPNPSTVIAAGAEGRYVRVQLTGANYLSLAEVQVFGQ